MEDRTNQLVVCRNRQCKREYICLPEDDYYEATPGNNENGLCRKCFFKKQTITRNTKDGPVLEESFS